MPENPRDEGDARTVDAGRAESTPVSRRDSAPAPAPALWSAPGPDAPRRAVRRRLPDGSVGDVVGHVVARGADTTTVLPEDRPAVVVADDDVVAARTVPPRAVRPTSSAEDLERLAARGWPGVERLRLGGWLLRAGLGWTSRANSCLVAGDPGLPMAEALEVVVRFYRRRGLVPRLQYVGALGAGERATGPPRPEADRGAAGSARGGGPDGWVAYDETLMLVADLRRLDLTTGAEGVADRRASRWADRPDDDWLAVNRGGEGRANPAVARVLSAAPAQYLTVADDTGPVAVARVARTDDWTGLAGVEVTPGARRTGLGTRVTVESLAWARRYGARFAYLQVQESNPVALRLYERLGFRRHHTYHYARADG